MKSVDSSLLPDQVDQRPLQHAGQQQDDHRAEVEAAHGGHEAADGVQDRFDGPPDHANNRAPRRMLGVGPYPRKGDLGETQGGKGAKNKLY